MLDRRECLPDLWCDVLRVAFGATAGQRQIIFMAAWLAVPDCRRRWPPTRRPCARRRPTSRSRCAAPSRRIDTWLSPSEPWWDALGAIHAWGMTIGEAGEVEVPLLDGWGVTTRRSIHATARSTRRRTISSMARRCNARLTAARRGSGRRRSALPEWSGLTMNATWHIEPGLPQQPATLYLGRIPACSSALMMPAKPGSRTAASWRTPRVIGGFPAAAGCFAIRSSLIQASRNACTSVSPRWVRSGPMMADKPGSWSTRTWRPQGCGKVIK